MKGSKLLGIAALLMVLLGLGECHIAQAAPVLGGKLYGSGSLTTATILHSDSGYDNFVWKLAPLPGVFVGIDNHVTGVPVELGTFTACDEILMGIISPDGLFVTGEGSRNPDGLMHASVEFTDADTAIVSWEDLLGGGDFDYNDAIVRIDGVSQFLDDNCSDCPPSPHPAPEPGTMAMVGVGSMGLLLRRWRMHKDVGQ